MKNLLLLFVLLLGCHDSEITLNEDDKRFAALYADLLLLQVDYERISANSGTFSKLDSLQKLFSLHHLSPAQFNAQFSRYKEAPARWLKVQDLALSLLNKRREQSVANPSNNQ